MRCPPTSTTCSAAIWQRYGRGCTPSTFRGENTGMRSIWKGSLSFGLVNVPIKLYSATEDHDVPLHQVHDKDGGRIRYKRVCEIDGEVVEYENIAKAYVDGDQTVILTDEDFKALPAERSKDIDVVEFVPSDQVDPIMFD